MHRIIGCILGSYHTPKSIRFFDTRLVLLNYYIIGYNFKITTGDCNNLFGDKYCIE